MLHTLKVYLLCLPFTLLLDYLWLAKLMQGFYIKELGPYARVRGATIIPVYWAAAIVYLLLPLVSCCLRCRGSIRLIWLLRHCSGAGCSAWWSTGSMT